MNVNDCDWFSDPGWWRIPGSCLGGRYDVKQVMSAFKCREHCERESGANPCCSVNYDPATRQCFLNHRSRLSQPEELEQPCATYMDYHERLHQGKQL